MSEEPNIVGVILARGGSKRLPRKNILPFAGKPLIAHTIEAAKGARALVRFIVSTDDPEIAKIAVNCGAEVPFIRPAELAQDDSLSIDVLKHAADWLDERGPSIDAIVLLQPTSPLRKSRHIDEAIALYLATGVDTVTAVSPAASHPFWCWQVDGIEIRPFFSRSHIGMRSQMLPPALVENGALYVVKRDLLATGSLYGNRVAGYLMDRDEAVDIDTKDDFENAQLIASRQIR